MTETKKCAHPACGCIASDHQKYCSQTCQDAKNMTELYVPMRPSRLPRRGAEAVTWRLAGGALVKAGPTRRSN